MTSLGASIARPEVIDAVAAILPHFVDIDDLQRLASRAIAEATGAEAGCVTACAAAGVSIGIAGTMTGADLAAIEALPAVAGAKKTVVIQQGHLCNYSAPIDQAIRLTGADVKAIGTVNEARSDQLAAGLDASTAAMLFVVSHQTVQHGMIGLDECVRVCAERGVPVIVDAAAETDLTGFLSRGAGLAIYSAHKSFGGMTAGIVAGRKDLVRAAYLQNAGIGRGMKVGKEGIVGAIAALEAWRRRDGAAERAEQRRVLDLWRAALAAGDGISTGVSDDPTGNPVQRLSVAFDDSGDGADAARFAARLAAGDPAIVVRGEFLDRNMFELDPCQLHPGEAETVAEALRAACRSATGSDGRTLAELRREAVARRLAWPDRGP